MKRISQQEQDRLIEYLDDTMPEHAKPEFEQMLAVRDDLRERLEEFRSVDKQLAHAIRLEDPSRNFTQKVINRLDQYPLASGSSSRNALLLLAGVLAAVGIGAVLLSAGVFDGAGSIQLSDVVIRNDYVNIDKSLPSIPFNGKLIVNIIIGLNLALAFLVIDKAILKPWFEKRTRMNY